MDRHKAEKRQTRRRWPAAAAAALVLAAAGAAQGSHAPTLIPHVQYIFLGQLTGFAPNVNHIQLSIAVIRADRTGFVMPAADAGDGVAGPVQWSLLGNGSAAAADAGVTPQTLPLGSVISLVGLPWATNVPLGANDPLRTGNASAELRGGIVVCPTDAAGRPVLPAPGLTCADVPGATVLLTGLLAGGIEWAATIPQ